ncbi:hypothetical protein NDU88_007543 [Pleurodeles waltl]|uniref:Uncharacterized protein n=1 Tax=Pleurodeles waltl TaxID=8319 RepID=A0AAV7SST1_PLEWA|nr:hypothetical protein NDU88_007543 [Pleurodeles waltl]
MWGLTGETEKDQRQRRASGPGVWAEAARSVRHGRRCSFRCNLHWSASKGAGLLPEGKLFWNQGAATSVSTEDKLCMTPVRYRPRGPQAAFNEPGS